MVSYCKSKDMVGKLKKILILEKLIQRIKKKKGKKSLPPAGLEPAFLGFLVQAITQYTNVHLVGRRSNPYTYKL